jgi:hypothetical protein
MKTREAAGKAAWAMVGGLVLTACSEITVARAAEVKEEKPKTGERCATVPKVEEMTYGQVELPARGHFYLESHLATDEDTFEEGRIFPEEATEGIEAHLERSCALLLDLWPGTDCDTVYRLKWAKRWTPSEKGKVGQGVTGDRKPSPIEEMFTFNMMWKKKPKIGTRYLLRRGPKYVVAIAGYEVGPGDKEILGGVQAEVQYYLDATNASTIEVSLLQDQELPPGPIACDSDEKDK